MPVLPGTWVGRTRAAAETRPLTAPAATGGHKTVGSSRYYRVLSQWIDLILSLLADEHVSPKLDLIAGVTDQRVSL
jgi:hypothetical protein